MSAATCIRVSDWALGPLLSGGCKNKEQMVPKWIASRLMGQSGTIQPLPRQRRTRGLKANFPLRPVGALLS